MREDQAKKTLHSCALNEVSGTGSLLGDAPRASKAKQSSRSRIGRVAQTLYLLYQVTGHVQGYVFTWNEAGMKF